jgi:hypothetical protein
VLSTLACIPICVAWLFTGRMLAIVGVKEDVCALAQTFNCKLSANFAFCVALCVTTQQCKDASTIRTPNCSLFHLR